MEVSRGPGWIFSAVVHCALLAAALIALPDAKKFTDAQETVPVEILTEEQVNQIVKGSKLVKKDRPNQRADKIAKIIESNPKPPIAEAKKNIPTPPPPLKKQIDPGQNDKPEPPKPVAPTAAVPPPRPQREAKPDPVPAPLPPRRPPPPVKKAEAKPAKPQVAKAEPPKPVAKDAITPPVPPKRPKPKPEKKVAKLEPEKPVAEPPKKVTPPVPLPPRRPKNLPRVAKPKIDKPKNIKPKPDRLAKLIKENKTRKTSQTRSRPKSGEESNEKNRRFDTSAINRLLSKEPAQRRSSSGRTVQRQARRGSQTASAAKMSPSMWGQLDGLMQEQYKRCWSYLGIAQGRRYIPQIRVAYAPSGKLTARPVLLNPPSDPALKSLADSAVRAVRKCDPLRIPPQFAPYYDQWKARILRFDPEEMLG